MCGGIMRMKSVARNACALAAMSLALGARAELRIAELCPKTAEVYDANGLESGWVELCNDGATAFPIAGKASSFAFSGFGEVGDFGGDYEAFPGLGLRLR